MLSAISLWVRQIVMVVMFATFVDFMIPENKFLRYIKVFLGLLIMIAIIDPVVPLFQKGFSFDEIPLAYQDLVDKASIISKSETLSKSNNKLTIDEYKTQVATFITDKIADMTLYDVKDVTVKVDEDYSGNNFGRITQLSVVLGKDQAESGQSKHEKILVETIKIGNNAEKSSLHNHNRNDEFKDIIKYLHTTFDIPEENIHIDLED